MQIVLKSSIGIWIDCRESAAVFGVWFIHRWRRDDHHDLEVGHSVPGRVHGSSGSHPPGNHGQSRTKRHALVSPFLLTHAHHQNEWLDQSNFRYTHRAQLPYLEAFLHEVLRYCGVTPGMWRTTTADCKVGVSLSFNLFKIKSK